MNVFGIGLPELALIAAIGLLVFGPRRLPELGRTLGRTLKGFQSASSEFEREFRSAVSHVEPLPETTAEPVAGEVLAAESAGNDSASGASSAEAVSPRV